MFKIQHLHERGNEFTTATGAINNHLCVNDKIHTFTGPGTFTVERIATASPTK